MASANLSGNGAVLILLFLINTSKRDGRSFSVIPSGSLNFYNLLELLGFFKYAPPLLPAAGVRRHGAIQVQTLS